jgi:hypothetical protein
MAIDSVFVEQANRANATGFGSGPVSVKGERLRVDLTHKMLHEGLKAYFNCSSERRIAFTVSGDGTVTSEEDRLMWIQAPWGMRWEGGSMFSGSACRVSWPDATRLFGRGPAVGLSDSDTIALAASQIGSTSASAGYARGSCRVTFAGHSDWRLPTVADWHTVIGLEWEKSEVVFPLCRSDERYWSATLRTEPVPDWLLRSRNRIAWAGNFGRSILDCGVMEQYAVMFVRTV